MSLTFTQSIAEYGLTSPWEPIIQAETGGDFALSNLVRSVISVESDWQPAAVRPEPTINDASYGLMQVLYNTAAWLGYHGEPAGLLDPATNIHWGTAYLKWQLGRYGWGQLSDVISAYNGGTTLRLTGGGFTNQAYVDAVNTYYVWYTNNAPGPTTGNGTTDGGGTGGNGSSLDLGSLAPVVLILGVALFAIFSFSKGRQW